MEERNAQGSGFSSDQQQLHDASDNGYAYNYGSMLPRNSSSDISTIPERDAFLTTTFGGVSGNSNAAAVGATTTSTKSPSVAGSVSTATTASTVEISASTSGVSPLVVPHRVVAPPAPSTTAPSLSTVGPHPLRYPEPTTVTPVGSALVTPASLAARAVVPVPYSATLVATSSQLPTADTPSPSPPPPPPPATAGGAATSAPQLHDATATTATAIKMLVSNNVAGSIIGRSGQTISELQSESGTRLKLSQSGDYYPGSQDRVCLVQGEPDNVKLAIRLLLERLYMLQETQHTPAWQKSSMTEPTNSTSFDFVVRLLVPLSCCGMIIGKSGANIKYMEETSGVASIRLSPKEESIMAATSERIVTLTGKSVESCLRCTHLILDSMMSHPETSHYTNMTTSYANSLSHAVVPSHYPTSSLVNSPAPTRPMVPSHHGQMFLPSGPLSPQPTHSIHHHHSPSDHHQQHHIQQWGDRPQTPSQDAARAGVVPRLSRRSASTPNLPSAITASTRPSTASPRLHNSGEVTIQPAQLLGYGSLGATSYIPLQIPQASVGFSTSPHHPPIYIIPRQGQVGQSFVGSNEHGMTSHTLQQQQNPNIHHQAVSPSSSSAPNLLAAQMEQTLVISHHPQQAGTPPPNYQIAQQHPPNMYNTNPAFVPQTPTMIAPGCFNAQVLVPDTMIGSVLGRGGRALNELQMLSGTRIRISQRGEYMPGTRSRIVTIRGPTAPAVWHAEYLMSQRMVLPPTATYNNAPIGAAAPSVSHNTTQSFDQSEESAATAEQDVERD